MSKKFLTVIAVLFFFMWGTLSWVTADLLFAEDQLELLANLRVVTYTAVALAGFLRLYLRDVSDERILSYGAVICVLELLMMVAATLIPGLFPILLPAGYLLIGITRIFLTAATLGLADKTFGGRYATILTGGSFYAANAVLSPVIEEVVEANRSTLCFVTAIVLLIVSAYVTLRLEKILEAEKRGAKQKAAAQEAIEKAVYPPSALGKGVLIFVGIQACYGLFEIALFPIAELLLGQRTDAGRLKGLRQLAALLGVLVAIFYGRKKMSVRLLFTIQCAGLILLFIGVRFGLVGLCLVGIFVEGATFATLERESETMYLDGIRDLKKKAVVRQFIDGASRLAFIPFELLAANAPLFQTLGVAPMLPLLIIVALSTPLQRWIMRVLRWVGS